MGTGIKVSVINQIKEYAEQKAYDKALTLIRQQDLSQSYNSQFVRICGEVLLYTKNYEECRKVLIMAHKIAPEGNRIIYDLIRLYVETGESALADKYYEQYTFNATEHDTDLPWLNYMMARSRRASGQELYNALESLYTEDRADYIAYEFMRIFQWMGETEKFEKEYQYLFDNFRDSEYRKKARNLKEQGCAEEELFIYPESSILQHNDKLDADETLLLEQDYYRMYPKEPEIVLMTDDYDAQDDQSIAWKIWTQKRREKAEQKAAVKAEKKAAKQAKKEAEAAEKQKKTEAKGQETEQKKTDETKNQETQPKEAEEAKEPETQPKEAEEAKEPEMQPKEAEETKEPETQPKEAEEAKEPETQPKEAEEVKEPETQPKEAEETKEPETQSEQAEVSGVSETAESVDSQIAEPEYETVEYEDGEAAEPEYEDSETEPPTYYESKDDRDVYQEEEIAVEISTHDDMRAYETVIDMHVPEEYDYEADEEVSEDENETSAVNEPDKHQQAFDEYDELLKKEEARLVDQLEREAKLLREAESLLASVQSGVDDWNSQKVNNLFEAFDMEYKDAISTKKEVVKKTSVDESDGVPEKVPEKAPEKGKLPESSFEDAFESLDAKKTEVEELAQKVEKLQNDRDEKSLQEEVQSEIVVEDASDFKIEVKKQHIELREHTKSVLSLDARKKDILKQLKERR